MLYICFSVYLLLFTSNPFLVNSINVKEGLGLNPILQDPALAIHPPMLYIGYVGFSLILSLALAGLVLDKIRFTVWIKTTKNWTLFCWSMLTGGIALGSYWAYYELRLGWVVVLGSCRKCFFNALDYWIGPCSFTHDDTARTTFKKMDCFPFYSLFLTKYFWTFLVRSGILTSVHSFANDASRGIFILILFLVITGFSFILFIFKSTDSNKRFEFIIY